MKTSGENSKVNEVVAQNIAMLENAYNNFENRVKMKNASNNKRRVVYGLRPLRGALNRKRKITSSYLLVDEFHLLFSSDK